MKKKPVPVPEIEAPGNPPILLRLPPEICQKLIAESAKRKCSIQEILLGLAADYFEVETPFPKRGRPKKTT